MLRQAMDAAEGQFQQQQQHQYHQQQQDETARLLSSSIPPPSEATTGGFGTAHAPVYDEEDESMLEDESEDDWSEQQRSRQQPPGMTRKAWDSIRNAFLLVANVENLWDSPVPNQPSGGDGYRSNMMYTNGTSSSAASVARLRRRSYLIVLFWFFVLAGAYAMERSTFKLLVDRAGPFRLFSVEMVTLTHALMLGAWMVVSSIYQSRQEQDEGSRISLGIPLVDVGYMALLDTFHLLLVFLTGRYVCPTLTVILVQFTLPLSAFLTQFVHSDGRCAQCFCRNSDSDDNSSDGDDNRDEEGNAQQERGFGGSSYQQQQAGDSNGGDNQSTTNSEGMPLPGWGGLSAEHLWGSLILSLAVLLASLPSFYSIINPSFFAYADQIPIQTAYNTLIYVSSCFPAAASQLYKEHVFLQSKQPVNASYLNFLLSLFQFILASIMTPLVFGLQGLGAGEDWTSLYPSSHFSNNFLSGLKCFLGLLPEDAAQQNFPEPANCDLSMGLVIVHAFSIVAVGCAVDKIVNAGATKAMYRGISAGIIVAVLLMYEYDMHTTRFNYGPAIDALNLVCLILLIVGAEVYHRVSLTDSVFETVYPTVEGLYEDEE
ncbi:expressed unknown protein [Seminavis robusta]|uniref:Transmembrane protein n=1 Tax=Seminavis robusta TaxID=568900 RepID=A0A9N8DZ55_9STRA|nr:expressed unknown protein [Seminavis robusta]|eukprot:Sro486_g152610.1 n/a (599) ;mRNA; r:28546-30455